MSTAPTIDVGGGALAVGLAVGCGLLAFLALAEVAKPSDYSARKARVEAQITAAEQVLSGYRRASVFPAQAVCSAPEKGAEALKGRLQAAAAATGLTLSGLSAAPGPPTGDDLPLTAINLQFEANGRYDQVLSMLSALGRGTPSIFVDTADLTSQVSAVDFKFQGRVYCSSRL